MTPSIAPGVFDILPISAISDKNADSWRASHLWDFVETIIRKTAAEYGFQEIRTPIFERTELFSRGVGETSDIVSKEMYTFLDKGNRSMSLRPEGTAAVLRAFLDNKIQQSAPIHKFFYIAPMFRYERAQAGRYRQHHQFGAEVIGSKAPEQDVEIIDMIYTLYSRLGLKNLSVGINSIGDTPCRLAYRNALVDYLKNRRDELSADSKVRLETNPLRILDSKDPTDKEITAGAPSILEFLSPECQEHFNDVQALLKSLGIPFHINTSLVRGLDYYNRTVFEITSGELGAQNSVAGGGRYDSLLKTLGGPDLPGTGFATGLERVIQAMIKQGVELPAAGAPEIFLIPLGKEARMACFSLLHNLRVKGMRAAMDFSDRKINKIMQYANQINAQHVVVIGEEELKAGTVELKNMATGDKRSLPITQMAAILVHEKKNEAFLKSLEELNQPFENQEEAEFFIKNIDSSIADTSKAAENLKNAIQSMQKLLDS
jgi:histidyl-tRNA synthetase